MIVVYFTPRTGSTFYAKSLADKMGMSYGNEIFWAGPFSKNVSFDVNEVFDGYVDTVLNGFSQHKNSVVKINPGQLENVARRGEFGMNLLIKKINKCSDQIHFCVRKNISDQLRSTYALFSIIKNSSLTDSVSHEDISHNSWIEDKHIEYNPTLLNNCKQLIRNNLITMSSVYNSLPDNQRKLVVYEDWADTPNRYKRPMTFENENFDVDFQLSDFFAV